MSEWIEWNGEAEAPVASYVIVKVKNNNTEVQGRAGDFDWQQVKSYQVNSASYSATYCPPVLKPFDTAANVRAAMGLNEKPASSPIGAERILRRAADLIASRAAQRDQPSGEKSMGKTVAMFNTLYGTELTEVQGWHFMELLKMVRSAYGEYVADDFEDKVAYAALAAEAAE